MESVEKLFLEALRASLQKKTVDWDYTISTEQWHSLFQLASLHHVLPMIYESTVHSPAARKADQHHFMTVRKQAIQTIMIQTMKTNAFLHLLSELVAAGVTPLVVKGIICRELYPNPDYRISGDEDILIPEEQADLCHRAMLDCGMYLYDPEQDMSKFEISYRQKGSHLHIELHKQLFLPHSDVYGEFNRYFEHVHTKTITQTIQGVAVPDRSATFVCMPMPSDRRSTGCKSGNNVKKSMRICLRLQCFV